MRLALRAIWICALFFFTNAPLMAFAVALSDGMPISVATTRFLDFAVEAPWHFIALSAPSFLIVGLHLWAGSRAANQRQAA